jgi:hypothetical protein
MLERQMEEANRGILSAVWVDRKGSLVPERELMGREDTGGRRWVLWGRITTRDIGRRRRDMTIWFRLGCVIGNSSTHIKRRCDGRVWEGYRVFR